MELKKRVPDGCARFLFFRAIFSIMSKKKNTKKPKEIPVVPETAKPAGLASFRLSSGAFYGMFLSIGLLVTGLLFGNALQVSGTRIVTPELPDRNAALAASVRSLTGGYPIERMTVDIARRNRTTAAFLVGIAKKESNWGKRSPRTDDGEDCYNYWGYRGAGSRGIAMGHGCFGSPEEAVGVVGGRLDTLIREYRFDTPEELIVWKCGWSCNGHSSKSVKKWIADVGYYYEKVRN